MRLRMRAQPLADLIHNGECNVGGLIAKRNQPRLVPRFGARLDSRMNAMALEEAL